MKAICTAASALALVAGVPASATIIGFEDFDGGAINLNSALNVFDYGSGGGTGSDVFGRVSPWAGGLGTGGPFDVWDDTVVDMSGGGAPFPGDTLGIAGENSTAFFAMNDMDGSGMPTVFTEAIWSFDISGGGSVSNIMMDIAAMGDFEASSNDGFLVEAQVDGLGYVEIFRAETDESAFKTYRPFDNGTTFSDDDPLALYIDGSSDSVGFLDKSDAATGLFDTYTSTALAGLTGSTVDLKISWRGTPSGSEPMGFDNLTINAVPAPGVLALLGLAGLVSVRRRRR